jgi:prepilin-type N-terminal cleavage/methylation domain-containing protein
MIKSFKYKKGMGLVEILVAVFIFSVVLGVLITINNFYLSNSSKNIKLTKATYLAEEGIEAVRIIRDNSWSNISSLSNSVDYYLSFNIASSTWEATTSPSSIDSYIRKFNLLEVERDINGKIVSSGGAVDLYTKLVNVYISWQNKGSTTTKSMSFYISNIISD